MRPAENRHRVALLRAEEGDPGAEYYNHSRHLPISAEDAIFMDKWWRQKRPTSGRKALLHGAPLQASRVRTARRDQQDGTRQLILG